MYAPKIVSLFKYKDTRWIPTQARVKTLQYWIWWVFVIGIYILNVLIIYKDLFKIHARWYIK